MALYYVPKERGELAHRPGVTRPVQSVEHAIGLRGSELRPDRRDPLTVRVSAFLAERLSHGAHTAQPAWCLSSEIHGEISSEGGRR